MTPPALNPRGHRGYRRWTETEDATLRRLWDQGIAVSTIAHELRRSRAAVYLRRFTRGLDRRQKYYHDEEEP